MSQILMPDRLKNLRGKNGEVVKLDHRESKEVKREFLSQYPAGEVVQLEHGDIAFGTACIEHKNPEDYKESLQSGHLFTQIKDMNNNFKNFAILVDGDPSELLDTNPGKGSIASCFARGAPVLFCGDTETFITMSLLLLEKWNDGKDRNRQFNNSVNVKLSKDHLLNIVTGIPGVSKELGESLLTEFGSIENLCSATIPDLKKIPRIGPKKAEKIVETLHKNWW